jgi:hypothetical protein
VLKSNWYHWYQRISGETLQMKDMNNKVKADLQLIALKIKMYYQKSKRSTLLLLLEYKHNQTHA